MEKVFVMRKRGKWFDEGHRSVWREIEKRGVCSGELVLFSFPFFLSVFFFSPFFLLSSSLFFHSLFPSFLLFILSIVFMLLELGEWTMRCSS